MTVQPCSPHGEEMSILERAARAVADYIGAAAAGKTTGSADDFEMGLSRAVLMAVREPDDRTLTAGCSVGPDTNNGCFSYDDARPVFTAMIDAILNEGER